MSKKQKYYVIHCLATPEGREIKPETVLQWHMAPCDNKDGTVTYKGKKYPSRDKLPDETINGFLIKNIKGRGWPVPGYTKIYHLDGSVSILKQNNFDGIVDPWELTYGVSGINAESIHVAYVGGCDTKGKPKDTRTPAQIAAMAKDALGMRLKFPDVEIVGHRDKLRPQDAYKACPSFDVIPWFAKVWLEYIKIGDLDPKTEKKV